MAERASITTIECLLYFFRKGGSINPTFAPVFASDIPVHREILADAALYFKPH